MRYELATPLLFANLLRWVAPGDFPPFGNLGGQRGNGQAADGSEVAGNESQGDRRRRRGAAVHVARPDAEFLLRRLRARCAWWRAIASILYSLTLPQLGDSSGSRRRAAEGHSARLAVLRRLHRNLAVAGVGRRRGSDRRVAAVRRLPARAVAMRPGAAAPQIARGNSGRCGDDASIIPGRCCWCSLPIAWAAWEWRIVGAPPRLVAEGRGLRCRSLLRSGGSRGSRCMRARSQWRCWPTLRPAFRRQDLQTESSVADQLERARGRHWTRVIPFARATRVAGGRRAPEEQLAAAPHGGAGGPRHQSGGGDARRRRRAARRHGAAPPAGLRRQRESGQRRARHLAGAAARHPDRHGPAAPAVPNRACCSSRSRFPGQVFSGERFPDRSHARTRRGGHANGRDDGRRQVDRQQPGRSHRRRESFAPAGDRQLGGRHRRWPARSRPRAWARRASRMPSRCAARASCWSRAIRQPASST